MFIPCGFLDTWALSTSLYRKERREQLAAANGRLVIQDAGHTMPLDDWPSLKNLLRRATQMLTERAEIFRVGECWLEELPPSQALPWACGAPGELIAHLAVVTNPNSVLFAGKAASGVPCLHIPVGDIVAHDAGLWRSALNGGSTTRIHLVMRLTKEAEEPRSVQ